MSSSSPLSEQTSDLSFNIKDASKGALVIREMVTLSFIELRIRLSLSIILESNYILSKRRIDSIFCILLNI